jgi:hypothetical protein
MIGLLTVALAAGITTVSAPHIKAMLSASSSAAGLPGACAAPAAAGSARPAMSDAAAAAPMATADSGTPSASPTSSGVAPAPAASPRAKPCPSLKSVPPPSSGSDCELVVPADPLSAAGLATPYQLTGPDGASPAASGCTMANEANLGAFVQATILDQATGKLWVYEPLVITKGTKPATTPVMPKLPKRAVVTIDVGFNGNDLKLVGATRRALRQGHCHNGLGESIFGQVSFCRGGHFFLAARRAERQGKLVVPRAGVSPKTRQACPTTRSFTLVDQDPSDNVTTKYLLTAAGRTAQFNRANAATLPGATVITNGSDNALLDDFVDPVLGCKPFTAPDLSEGGAPGTSQALDELSAARSQAAPAALVPENDPMVLFDNAFNIAKTDMYRANIGQPTISSRNDAVDSPAKFCQNMINIQTRFLSDNQTLLASGPSPVPAIGNNLLTFMANRLVMSYTNLNCGDFNLANTIKVSLNGNGAAIAATFDTTQQTATDSSATAPSAPR